jgi:hypothetical protein
VPETKNDFADEAQQQFDWKGKTGFIPFLTVWNPLLQDEKSVLY